MALSRRHQERGALELKYLEVRSNLSMACLQVIIQTVKQRTDDYLRNLPPQGLHQPSIIVKPLRHVPPEQQ